MTASVDSTASAAADVASSSLLGSAAAKPVSSGRGVVLSSVFVGSLAASPASPAGSSLADALSAAAACKLAEPSALAGLVASIFEAPPRLTTSSSTIVSAWTTSCRTAEVSAATISTLAFASSTAAWASLVNSSACDLALAMDWFISSLPRSSSVTNASCDAFT